ETLFDYVPNSPIVLEPLVDDSAHERFAQIKDYYDARRQALGQRDAGPPYKPLSPERLYLAEAEWRSRLEGVALARLTPFAVPQGDGPGRGQEQRPVIELGTRQGHNFAAERAEPGRNVFEAVTRHVRAL